MVTSVTRRGDNFNSSFNYAERMGELSRKLQDYETRLNLGTSAKLAVVGFSESPSALLNKNIVNIPSWFLFKYEDIPARFRVADINDPRLTNTGFLNEVAHWMNEKIGEAGLSGICRPADRGRLQAFLKLLRDPEFYEKSKEFTLGHELAHLSHAQTEQQAYLMQGVQQTVSIGGVIAGLYILFLSVSLLPVVNIAVSVGVAALAIVITIGGILVWLNRTEIPPSPSSIEEEKRADLDAVAMLGDARGGIYSFSNEISHNLAVRRGNPIGTTNIDDRGNNLRDTKHPSLTDRVAYLRQWQSQHYQRA